MSLASISTELDEKIVTLLDQQGLHALCLTSAYYRSLAEPHLYRNLTFCTLDGARIQRLLLALIKRHDLTRHIRTVSFEEAQHGFTAAGLEHRNLLQATMVERVSHSTCDR